MSKLQDALETAGYETRGYSGRCMYGKVCVSLTTKDTLGTVVCKVMAEGGVSETLLRKIGNARTDSLGLGVIYYWPDVSFVGEG